MASFEQQALDLVRATQAKDAATRNAAEQQLAQFRAQDDFALALVTIAAHREIDTAERLSALVILKQTIYYAWSPAQDAYEGGPLLSAQAKDTIRNQLLRLVFEVDTPTKIISNVSGDIAKIASSDFPEEWPTLLDTIIGQIGQSSDDQIHAILKMMDELIFDGLEENTFYTYATPIVSALHHIATNGNKKLMCRAHAISVFRSCYDFVENLKDKEEVDIMSFTKQVCDGWAPFFLQVVQEPLPPHPSAEEEEAGTSQNTLHHKGVVALKIQVVLTLARIHNIFPDLMPAQEFFEAAWNGIQMVRSTYYESYVNGDRQGNLMDQYNLQYTLDFLVLEEIDYVQVLLDAPLVQQHLNGMREADAASGGSSVRTWVSSLLETLVTFSAITTESESMWDIDFIVFLSEEAFSETSNSPRSVCAGFVNKISSWFPQETLEGLLTYAQPILADQQQTWRIKDSILYMLQQVAEEFNLSSRQAAVSAIQVAVQLIHPFLADEKQYLRARAYIAMATVLGAWAETLNDHALVMNYAGLTLNGMEKDSEDLVKVSCIRVMKEYLTTLPSPQATELQPRIIKSISDFLDTQDFEEMDECTDLVDAVLQTVRDTIMANPETSLDHNALDVILLMVKYGAARDSNSAILIDEAFEFAAQAMAKLRGDYYSRLCQKILPSLLAIFDIEGPDDTQTTALTDVCVSVLKILAEEAVDPLPAGFIHNTLPRICKIIFSDADFYQRQTATLCIKHMLLNDKDQVFNWIDPSSQRSGLQMCFQVIAHLLGPDVDDASAAQVGELAMTVIEAAGTSALGESLNELLQIVTSRLATAEHHDLIQSLSMVFARLSLINAPEIVNFLSSNQVNGASSLEVVIRKWLENAGHFAGFDTIRQNTHALVAIYRLRDSRVDTVVVSGDLVPDTDTRIKTRSMAKKQPIRYTSIPALLKIIKLLVADLTPYGDAGNAFGVASGSAPGSAGLHPRRRNDSDDEWESDDEGSAAGMFGKSNDDATQAFLVEFFQAEGADGRFQELFGQLSEAEKKRALDSVEQRNAANTQRQG